MADGQKKKTTTESYVESREIDYSWFWFFSTTVQEDENGKLLSKMNAI